MDLHWQFCGNF